MSRVLAESVVHRYLLAQEVQAHTRAAGFLPQKFFRERKAELKAILTKSGYSNRPRDIVYSLRDIVIPFFKLFAKDITQFGMTDASMVSINDRVDTATHIIGKVADGWAKFDEELQAALHYPAKNVTEEIEWSIAHEIGQYQEKAVPDLATAMKAILQTDRRLITGLGQRVQKKATPEILAAIEQASKEDFGNASRMKWQFFADIKLEASAKRLVTREKITWDPFKWFDFLYDVLASNYSSTVDDGFRQFDLYGMKVVVDDTTVTPEQVKEYVKYLDKAYHLLRYKKLDKVWYGTVFIRCDACGGVNYNTGGGVGGNYPIGRDVVNVFSRPSSFIVELMAHELGHRYWFKFMSQAQRGKFESLVKAHRKPRPSNVKPMPILSSKVLRAKNLVDEAATVARASLDAVKDPGKKFFRDVLRENSAAIARAGFTFSNAIQDAVHSPGADSQINPEVKQLLQDVLDSVEDVRRYMGDFDEVLTREIHKEPDPAKKPRSVDAFWRAVFERVRDAWLEVFEQKLSMAVANAFIYVDAAALAYNEKENGRYNEMVKEYDEEYGKDERPVAPVSNYGQSNIDEAFAEVFAHYVLEYDISQDQIESFRVVLASLPGVGSCEGEPSHDLRHLQGRRLALPRSPDARDWRKS